MSNSVRNKNPFRECQIVFATRIHPGLLGRLDKSMSPRVGDFAQKSYPRPNYSGGGGGPSGLHLIDPLRKSISCKCEKIFCQ